VFAGKVNSVVNHSCWQRADPSGSVFCFLCRSSGKHLAHAKAAKVGKGIEEVQKCEGEKVRMGF
jgi:hypothetical protein